MQTNSMSGPVVTQADLNAAADLIETYWTVTSDNMMRLARDVRNGNAQGVFPRAFARHRTAAEAAAKEREDALVDALEGLMAHRPDCPDTLWQNAEEVLARHGQGGGV